jgi:hypothetical protein
VTEVCVLCKVGELLTAEVVWNEAGLRAAVAWGGEVLVRAGATIELGDALAIRKDCAILGEPGGAAPPVLRRKGGGEYLIYSGEGKVLELRGLSLWSGPDGVAVHASGGRLAVRDCEVRAGGTGVWVIGGCRTGVWVIGGCQAELHGVTIQGCGCGVYASCNAMVALRGCTLRENGEDCREGEHFSSSGSSRGRGKIVREEA